MHTYTRTLFPIQFSWLALLLVLLLGGGNAGAVTYTWNGSVSTSWNTAANWTPAAGSPAGVPGAADEALINNCTTCPVLTGPQGVHRLAVNSGKLDVGGFTMTATIIRLGYSKITSQAGTLQVVAVEDIRGCEFLGGKITINIGPNGYGRIYGGNTYHGPVEYRWTDTSNPSGNSFIIGFFNGDYYAADAVFINDSIGWLSVAYSSQTYFMGKVTVRNNNQGRTNFGNGNAITASRVLFNQDVEVTNAGEYVTFASTANTTAEFKGAVTVNNTNAVNSGNHYTIFGSSVFRGPVTVSHVNPNMHGNVSFYANGVKTVFTETSSLRIGPQGFTGGKLLIKDTEFRNPNAATQLVLGGGAIHLELGPNTSFAAPFEGKANNILLNGVTFTGHTKLEKFGGHTYSSTNNLGGNFFNGPTTLINSGGQPWYFGQNAADQFNGDLTVTHAGGNGTYLAHWSAGHVFKGNLSLNLTAGSAGTIQLGAGGGTSRLEADKTLTASFPSGDLRLFHFTQAGSTPQALALSAGAALTLGTGCTFEGPLTAAARDVYLNGATFRSPLGLTKLAGSSNHSAGGNKFYGKVTLLNQSGTGPLHLATQVADQVLQPPAAPAN